MEVFKPFISVVVYFLLLQLTRCTLPADSDPVKWKMHFEVPIVDEQYMLPEIIPEDAFSGLTIGYGETTRPGDTVSVMKNGTIHDVFEKQLGMIDTCVIKKKMGSLTLQKTPPVEVMFTFGPEICGNHSVITPLPSALRLKFSREKHPKWLQWITLDTVSPVMHLNVANKTDATDLQDVDIVLKSLNDTIAAICLVHIPPRTIMDIPISLAGKCIHFPVTIEVAVTVPAGSELRPSDGILIFFSFDRQVVSEVVMSDSFLNYSHVHSGTLKLADSLRLDAVDLDATILYCDISCTSLSKIEVGGTFENAWKRDYAVCHDLQSVEQLNDALDSTEFAGKMENDTLLKPCKNGHYCINKTVQRMRIFPSWDSSSKKSFIRFDLKIRSIPENRLIYYRKDDLIAIKLIIPQFPFDRISGSIMKQITATNSKNIKFGFQWKPSITDSLKKVFRFSNAQLQLSLASDLPTGSCIDSLLVRIVMREKREAGDSAIMEKVFHTVSSDSTHSATMNITNVFNNWPDTVTFDTRFVLPSGTPVILQNSDERKIRFTSPLVITTTLDWNISVPLCWNVIDTVRLELDTTGFSFKSEQMEWIKKLHDPQIRIFLNVANHTNAGFTIHAIGACAKYRDELMAFPESLAGMDNDEYLQEKHLFSLFDNNGLHVEPRENGRSAVLQLDKEGINALLDRERCIIRWFLLIPAQQRDALHADDYCTLKATGIVEGVGNTDSLPDTDDW